MSLEGLFSPRSVVVLGASSDPGKLGYAVARNLLHGGYRGQVHLVNPRGGSLFGQAIYTSLQDLPSPAELAVLIVPAAATPQALRECAAAGIRFAIIASGGFRETGPQGAALEAGCLEIARQHDLRLLGPNCIGIADTHLPLDTTFLPPPAPPKGNIAFISHSGAFCAAMIDWSRQEGFGFSRLVSLGNQVDLTETDLLAPVAADPNTRVLALYLEGIPDGRRFVSETTRVSRARPIVVLKVGRSAAGQQAAASHTGALAGSETAYDAAFTKCGVLRANSAEEMFDWARALAACPLPNGRNMAILTNAGGPGVIAADALAANGLGLASLSPETTSRLRELLPPAASSQNPVDMLAAASPEQYAGCLSLLLEDKQVHGALVILPPSPNHSTEEIARQLARVIHNSQKPVLVCLMGSELVKPARQVLINAGFPPYPFPERAASALAALARRAEFLSAPISRRPGSPAQKPSPGLSAEELAAAYGIPIARLRLAASREQAAMLAAEVGFPIVLKIASPDISHKSDVGGVLLNIQDEEQARQGFDRLIKIVASARPAARLEGVTVQRQVPPGQEVILGMLRDPQFGPLLMFGSGGVEVEGLKDIAFGLAPLSTPEAEKMLTETWAGKKLDGFRSIPAVDKQAVINALLNLSRLAIENPHINEIEINPLRVHSTGIVAVDVRMV